MKFRYFVLPLFVGALAACANFNKNTGAGKNGGPVFYALAQLRPTKDSRVSGDVWFSEAFGRVKVEGLVSGLDPDSLHGFHIHEFGDCSGDEAAQVGEHYNPTGEIHGAPAGQSPYDSSARHIGDLGNLKSDKNGVAKIDIVMEKTSLNGSLNPILGRSVVIDKNQDDLVSQPSGGFSSRLACGVIGAVAKR